MENDNVNSPKHYKLISFEKLNKFNRDLEVIDVREAILNKIDLTKEDAFTIDLWSRAWEYLTRSFEKNGLEDLEKANWYLKKLIEHKKYKKSVLFAEKLTVVK
jgi:hypothetical protein